jgi:hypothetical protein
MPEHAVADASLGVAAVTAVLKDVLQNSVARGVNAVIGDVAVSALPPDRLPTGAEERARLNLYLYRVTPNTRWRAGGAPASGPTPLTLDLHYLLAAYGERDLEAEILLGHAASALHAIPALTVPMLEEMLRAFGRERSGPAAAMRAALGQAEVAERLGELTVVPEFMSAEESSRLWSALQARYRPALAFRVTAVTLGGDAP